MIYFLLLLGLFSFTKIQPANVTSKVLAIHSQQPSRKQMRDLREALIPKTTRDKGSKYLPVKGSEHLKYHTIANFGACIFPVAGRVVSLMKPSFYPYYIDTLWIWVHINDTASNMLDTIFVWSDSGGGYPDSLINEYIWQVAFPGFRKDGDTVWAWGLNFPLDTPYTCPTPNFWLGYSSAIYEADSTHFLSDVTSNLSSSQHDWGSGWTVSPFNWGVEASIIDESMGKEETVSISQLKFNVFPNPAKSGGLQKISYFIPVGSYVSLYVYDICGRLIEKLVDSEQKAGTYEVTNHISYNKAGIYFYRLECKNGSFMSGEPVIRKKFIVL